MPNVSTPDRSTWTIIELVRWTTDYFSARHMESPRAEAEILLAHALGTRRIDLYLNHDQPIEKDERRRFKTLIKRRLEGEPAAYITGIREFWSLDFMVDSTVLIPRPETECLVEAVLPFLKTAAGAPKRVLDMGTGSGAIVITLAHEYRNGWFLATDRSIQALRLARQNARNHYVDDRITWICGDWDTALKPSQEAFDLIVSNPPYIRSGDLDGLQKEIRDFEPRLALDGSFDGVACLRAIIQSAHGHLRPGGMLALEMGCDQAESVSAIIDGSGHYGDPIIIKDYSGLDRIAVTHKKH